ncbi:hypothetical protein [Pseudomonas fluorescens]|uniref:DUF488 family protein, N3 subclade n=1 Tax=Pseudomonas fluorescens TaxID=294 RepID=UPI0038FCDB98
MEGVRCDGPVQKCRRTCHAPEDGRRILVDRQWPPDCPRDSLALDAWLPRHCAVS